MTNTDSKDGWKQLRLENVIKEHILILTRDLNHKHTNTIQKKIRLSKKNKHLKIFNTWKLHSRHICLIISKSQMKKDKYTLTQFKT